MAGSLVIPNSFAGQSGNVPASELDTDFSTIATYVNNREVAVGLIGARPAAGVAGRWFLATDVNGGTVYVDTGAVWVQGGLVLAAGAGITITPGTVSSVIATTAATGGVSVLNAATTAVVVSNTAAETDLFSFSVPGGSLGTGGRLRLVLQGKGQIVSNEFTIRLKYGATTLASCQPVAAALAANSPTWIECLLSATGSATAQVGHVFYRSALSTGVVHQGGGRGTAAENSATARTLAVSIQFVTADTNNNYTMEHALLELLTP